MFNKKNIIASLAGIGFLIAIAPPKAMAQMPDEMSISKEKNLEFRRIEQPLGLKAAVTLGGIGLIGLELWWFLFSKPKAVQTDRNE